MICLANVRITFKDTATCWYETTEADTDMCKKGKEGKEELTELTVLGFDNQATEVDETRPLSLLTTSL